MNDLVAWLRAQMDEDEATAQAATKDRWIPDGTRITSDADGTVARMVVPSGMYRQRMADAVHIARYDPGRVLAEVEAKRRILDWLDDLERSYIDVDEGRRLVGLTYADQPGYREEWRP